MPVKIKILPAPTFQTIFSCSHCLQIATSTAASALALPLFRGHHLSPVFLRLAHLSAVLEAIFFFFCCGAALWAHFVVLHYFFFDLLQQYRLGGVLQRRPSG